MHSPCTVADDFDHQLAAGQKCGLVDSQFPIFHWFEWLFIDPNPLIALYEKRNKVCSGEYIFLFTCQVLPTVLKNPRIKILLA